MQLEPLSSLIRCSLSGSPILVKMCAESRSFSIFLSFFPILTPVIQLVDEEGRRHTAPEQPYIHRLSWLGVLAEEMGAGIEFADEVSSLIWGETKDWDQGDHMMKAAARAGLDLSSMEQRLQPETDRLEAEIVKNQADHHSVGHWGVPTCTFEGEPFFGQDRLDVLLWRLQQSGLTERV